MNDPRDGFPNDHEGDKKINEFGELDLDLFSDSRRDDLFSAVRFKLNVTEDPGKSPQRWDNPKV